MAGLIASKDWSATLLGTQDAWPPALRTVTGIFMHSTMPTLVLWGQEHVQLYNDAFRPLLGEKHPDALGQSAPACWSDIWTVIGPIVDSVRRTGLSKSDVNRQISLNRHGFLEDAYFTFCYSAIPDETCRGGIGGVLVTVQETTQTVLGESRLTLLRDLAALGSKAHTVEQECELSISVLASNPQAVPFACVYIMEETRNTASFVAATGMNTGGAALPGAIDLNNRDEDRWGFAHVRLTGEPVVLNEISGRQEKAVVLPLRSQSAGEIVGFLICGANARTRLDAQYIEFFHLISVQLSAGVANARYFEREHQRTAMLADIDRAKIAFFTDISHEFRTPLTLMLGPLEELRRTCDGINAPLVDTAHRNVLRLLKLVNTLLDFSRFEAGRADANFLETDLATLTRDLCSLFRSMIEGVGLRFTVDVTLEERVFVDRTMWEKIVLNLLSNALKYTFDGEICVQLQRDGEFVDLTVTDTGVGISEAEMPRIFERFHQIRGTRARTYEGSGIGLALVRELVQLHHGTIAVESAINEGSSFSVRIPLKIRHSAPALPREQHSLEVAQQYLADAQATITPASVQDTTKNVAMGENRFRILIADDNKDLRDYVSRLLSPGNEVFTVANGVEALEALRRRKFDLVISDAMMPQMDGFTLLQTIRREPAYAALPFILLSARAGEDSAIEGLTAGADDYLVKPFSAEEFLARVYSQLNAVAIRERTIQELRAGEERFRTLAASMPHIVVEASPTGALTYLSETYERYTGQAPETGYGDGWSSSIHPDDRAQLLKTWQDSLADGKPFREQFRMQRFDGQYRWHLAYILPQCDASGAIVRWTGTVTDIDEQRRAVQEREFLSHASRVLAQSLNLEETLQTIARLTVPELADWCHIDLRMPNGEIRTMAVAHGDPRKNDLAQKYAGKSSLPLSSRFGTPHVINTGLSEVLENAPQTRAAMFDGSPAASMYDQLGFRAAICIPLITQGKAFGAIALVYGDSQRRPRVEDIPMLEELARRAAIAVHNAYQFEREHQVAESFQEASLPAMLPQVCGVSFDAIYCPASEDIQVGGDWYDAVQLFDGRIVISIGDVTGNGLGAAITMGNMRQIIRGIAQVHADPALMLDAADRALRLEHPDQLATAFVGVLDPITYSFAYASAGHPPPLLRFANGEVEMLSDDGLPLGLRQGSTRSRGKKITIPDDSNLIFYTDGLTEYRRAPADGEMRLRELVADKSLFLNDHPAAVLKEAFLAGEPTMDDIAILIVSINTRQRDSDTSQVQRWHFNVLDAKAAQTARKEFTEGLQAYGATTDAVHAAELVFGELLGNAARHAPGPVEVIADWTGHAPVLHVLDKGPGFTYVPALPRDVYAESGRGLYIISLLSDEFHVSKRLTVGSHARAVLSKT